MPQALSIPVAPKPRHGTGASRLGWLGRLAGAVGLPRRTPIGVDVGVHGIKAVQFTYGAGGTLHVSALASFPRAELGKSFDDSEAARLGDVLRRRGFGGADVVLSLPEGGLLTATLELPPRVSGVSAESLDSIARSEFARIHKINAGSFEMAYWDLPVAARAGKPPQAMAVACPHESAEALTAAFASAGLALCTLDAPCRALARACAALYYESGTGEPIDAVAANTGNSAAAILDVGWSRALLVILYRGVIVYERAIVEAGVRALRDALATQLRLPADVVDYVLSDIGVLPDPGGEPAGGQMGEVRGEIAAHFDAVMQELRVSFAYAGHQYAGATVDQLLLCGGGAAMPGLAEYLAGGVGCGVRVVTPLASASCGRAWAGDCSPALALASGLAQFPVT